MYEYETSVIVIGAGISGLFISESLRKKNINVTVLEARPVAGGRIQSIYKDSKNQTGLQYESGPWRIPKSHTRALSLFAEYNVDLTPLQTPTPTYLRSSVEALPGLSTYDLNILNYMNPHRADKYDQSTGYADETFADSTTSPYETGSKEFFVAPKGFTSLIRKMTQNVDISYNTRVIDIEKIDSTYRIRCIRRNKTHFEEVSYFTSAVFICVPPGVAKRWPNFSHHNRIHLSRVEEGSLHHIYVHGACEKMHKIDATQPLVQTISDSLGRTENGWFQASYTGGRLAKFWHHLHLSYPKIFFQKIRSLLKTHSTSKRAEEIKSHFWETAYHIWRPVAHFDLKQAVNTSVYPNPIMFPYLFWAGEAYSSYQAWIEGALETSELAIQAFQDYKLWEKMWHLNAPSLEITHLPVRKMEPHEMIIENRIIGNLEKWSKVHPGSAGAIKNHLNEDTTQFIHHINHSENAWATIAALQVGWSAPEKKYTFDINNATKTEISYDSRTASTTF